MSNILKGKVIISRQDFKIELLYEHLKELESIWKSLENLYNKLRSRWNGGTIEEPIMEFAFMPGQYRKIKIGTYGFMIYDDERKELQEFYEEIRTFFQWIDQYNYSALMYRVNENGEVIIQVNDVVFNFGKEATGKLMVDLEIYRKYFDIFKPLNITSTKMTTTTTTSTSATSTRSRSQSYNKRVYQSDGYQGNSYKAGSGYRKRNTSYSNKSMRTNTSSTRRSNSSSNNRSNSSSNSRSNSSAMNYNTKAKTANYRRDDEPQVQEEEKVKEEYINALRAKPAHVVLEVLKEKGYSSLDELARRSLKEISEVLEAVVEREIPF